MITDNLITECSCGNQKSFIKETKNKIELLTCTECGVSHQYLPGWTSSMIVDFYKSKYHSEEQRKIGLREYKDRYEHDYQIAEIRLAAYQHYIDKDTKGLDVGSSNSAFVHAARNKGIDFIGIDPGNSIGDETVTIKSTFQDYDFGSMKFNMITMHDSFEHMVEVRKIVSKISFILIKGGYVIIDIPDYFVPAGLHHWRPIQHLWYWNKDQLINFLTEFGLQIINITNPIPGKLVFYAQK